MWFFWWYFL